MTNVTPDREPPPLTNVLFIVAGLGAIAVAILRLGNDIDYLPSDPRSQPWFDPVISSAIAIFGLFFLLVGIAGAMRSAARNRLANG